MDLNHTILLSGNANRALASRIAEYSQTKLANCKVSKFADGEARVEIEDNLRALDVVIIQPTCPPVNDSLMELLLLQDAARRASARSVTAFVPYFGYARQDRKSASRSPISAKVVADMITAAGAQRLLCVDLHAGQIQGFFNIPVDNLFAQPVFAEDVRRKYGTEDIVVVSPDVGGVKRARMLAKSLNDAPLAIIDKRRADANVAEVMNIIGKVKGKTCILIDDMIDTAGTMTKGAAALLEGGATSVVAYATHGIFSGPAMERLNDSILKEVVVTDSIPMEKNRAAYPNLRVVSIAPLLSEALRRLTTGESLSALFGDLPPFCKEPVELG